MTTIKKYVMAIMLADIFALIFVGSVIYLIVNR